MSRKGLHHEKGIHVDGDSDLTAAGPALLGSHELMGEPVERFERMAL
jgi:hypothetical protein